MFKNKEVASQIIEIAEADYVPLPEKEKPLDTNAEAENTEEQIKEKSIKKKEDEKNLVKEESSFKIPERKRPDLSWKKDVEKSFSKENINKITVSKLQTDSKKEVIQNTRNTSQVAVPISYVRMLGFLIRSHWYIPEDLGHKFYGLSAELEVTIDAYGNIKSVDVSRSSGNSVFDYYAREAVLRTGKFPLPPKELFATVFLNDKIIIEFKP